MAGLHGNIVLPSPNTQNFFNLMGFWENFGKMQGWRPLLEGPRSAPDYQLLEQINFAMNYSKNLYCC